MQRFLALSCFLIWSLRVCFSESKVSIDEIHLGMTSRQVVAKLGTKYQLVDLIRESIGEGEDYSLIFSRRDGLQTEVTFTFGKATSVDGQCLVYDGRKIKVGDRKLQVIKTLGKPQEQDATGLEYEIQSPGTRLILRLRADKVTSIVIEK